LDGHGVRLYGLTVRSLVTLTICLTQVRKPLLWAHLDGRLEVHEGLIYLLHLQVELPPVDQDVVVLGEESQPFR
jgi:hypothetical protein